MGKQRFGVSSILLVGLVASLAGPVWPVGGKESVSQIKSTTQRRSQSQSEDPQLLTDWLGERYRARARVAAQRTASSEGPDRQNVKVFSQDKRGVVAVQPVASRGLLAAPRAGENRKDAALRYVAENRAIFRLGSPSKELNLHRSRTDELGMTHLFFQQRHEGIPFWGRELVAHFDASGSLTSINCLIEPTPQGAPTEATISAVEAVAAAKKQLESDGRPPILANEDLASLGFGPPAADLHYWQANPGEDTELVWVVEIRPNIRDWMRFFVRASDGEILRYYNATNFDGPATAAVANAHGEAITINTYLIGSAHFMIDASRPMFVQGQSADQMQNNPQGVVATLDLRNQDADQYATFYHFTSADNTWSDTTAVTAHDYVGRTYNFYRNLENYSRNSFDDQGKSMIALVHVTEEGQPMDNAYWNGSFVALGDGKTYFRCIAHSLDAVAHEFTHAVVQYTANLEYQFQSGALNETYADIGGVSVDNDDFLLGEDIAVQQYFPTGAMRDMADPHNGFSQGQQGWQPAHINEYVTLTIEQDNGGVHVNNGITNLAAYKVLSGLGRHDGEQVLFRALVNYLTKQSNFTDFRIAAVQSAADLFGAGSAQEETVKKAFDDVGIVADGSTTQPPPDNPPVAGDQYILIVNDEYDPYAGAVDNSLYLSNSFSDISELTHATVLTATQVNVASGRPIAIDPYGQDIYFVDHRTDGSNHFFDLRGIHADGSGETALTNTGDWWSIAISPSGRRLAMTRSYAEKFIHVYDFATNPPTLAQLPLLHPTTDYESGYTDIVKYPDALVFADDRRLIYDCLNSVQSPGGEGTIDFWDVNVVDVETKKILALLPPQATGVSVMNPILASTNNSILCVDVYQPGVANQIVGVNLATGQSGAIVNNGADIGFSDYSVDDHYLLFTRGNASGGKDVYSIPLGADKISAAGDAGGVFSQSQLPIWFAVGTRPTVSVAFDATASSGAENVSPANILVSLSGASSQTVTVDYAVTGGNAIGGGVDYSLGNGTLTFNPNETSKPISVAVVDDVEAENAETIAIALSRPVNAWLGQNTVHTFTILDNDGGAPPTPTPTSMPGTTPTPGGEPIRDLITSFYDLVLGRAPETGAVDSWETGYFQYALSFDIDVRFIPREMARLFFLSNEYAARSRSNADFITDCYRVFLNRYPNQTELNNWTSGVWNRSQVMTVFSESEEFANRIGADGYAPDASQVATVAKSLIS